MIIMKIFASPSSTTSWRIAKSFLGKRGEVCLKTVLGEKLQWQWILEAQELLWSLGKSFRWKERFWCMEHWKHPSRGRAAIAQDDEITNERMW